MMFESADISMLRLLETFLKSAPQLVLQLSIMVQQNRIDPLQGLSASASLVSLAWTLASYQKVLRDSREDKMPMSYKGAVTQILWHLFTIAARAIAFALFASVFHLYFGIFIVTHWCIMTFWIIQGETDFCMSKWEEIIYNMVVGIIYIFCWFNVKEGRSRCRMSIYYVIILSENAAMTGLWYWFRDQGGVSESNALIVVCVVTSSFALGVFFMFIYYCLLHPNGTIFGPRGGGCMCGEEPTAVPCGAGPPADVITSPPRSLPRTTGAEREGVPGDRDSCVPVFQVRPSVPPTPVARAPRTEGPVIRIDLPRKKYPAWDAHFIDRRLRKTILALEYTSPATPRLQYRTVGVSQELLEYETTV
ncbi:XK-related protein 7-like [Lacerta agilis]|uniref:XK-related protein 7-like n=1 Tax=Lacerta agilis TaxID=80427 RepID=UPI0014191A66|nr:XK-related protein 7-like [Lacerta agilis]XP_033009754.1 XK-related protein 7-like [Lacerta agilis]